MPSRRLLLPALLALATTACVAQVGDVTEGDLESFSSSLTAAQRRARAAQIRDAAAANGITQGWLLAGIADAETHLSHCWSELTWSCRGPSSPDCGGGPVVAGSGDGPCSARQGGLGMFQFDAGTFDQTLAREGSRVLSIEGNVAAAVDFVVDMVIDSSHISGVSTEAEAKAWINGVRIGNGRWDAWIRTVTHYYNGCAPGWSCFPSRYARYRDYARDIHDEMGAAFWAEIPGAPTPASPDPSPVTPDPSEPDPSEPRPSGASCTHSFGGTYADTACSASWQCCDGSWGAVGTCGACLCTEPSGTIGCTAPGAVPTPPPGASCTHSYGGAYANTACSRSWQCCDGRWGARGSCGACFCVEEGGVTGCGT